MATLTAMMTVITFLTLECTGGAFEALRYPFAFTLHAYFYLTIEFSLALQAIVGLISRCSCQRADFSEIVSSRSLSVFASVRVLGKKSLSERIKGELFKGTLIFPSTYIHYLRIRDTNGCDISSYALKTAPPFPATLKLFTFVPMTVNNDDGTATRTNDDGSCNNRRPRARDSDTRNIFFNR